MEATNTLIVEFAMLFKQLHIVAVSRKYGCVPGLSRQVLVPGLKLLTIFRIVIIIG